MAGQQVDRALRIKHAPWRVAYPHDQHSFPSTPSTRLTRLASLPRVYRSYLFYNGVRVADLWGIFAMRSRKSRHKQRAAPGEPARCVNNAGRAARGRAGVAPGHNLWAVCSAVRPDVLRPCLSNEMLVCLAFEQPVQFGYRCLVRPCAHVERSTHACSVPRFEVVTRSESVASVRFRSRVLATAARKL